MSQADAAPVDMTIADDDARTVSPRPMVGRREEAQRSLDRELKGGLPPLILAMAGSAFSAVSRGGLPGLAGLPYATA
jgi:hypothetical protein